MARPMMVGRAVQRYRVVSQVLWTPLNLGSALVAWWDASDTAHMTFNGANVASWTDRAHGIIASQTTAANQPSYSATARNGKPGVTSSVATSPSQSLPFNFSSFPVGNAAHHVAVAACINDSGNLIGMIGWGGGGGTLRLVSTRSGAVFGIVDYNSSVQDNINHLGKDAFLQSTYDGNKGNLLYSDGGQTASGSFAYNTASTGSAALFQSNGSSASGVTMQQVVVANRPLTTSERQKLEGWESWVDGKAGANLPASHPYKSRAPYVSDP